MLTSWSWPKARIEMLHWWRSGVWWAARKSCAVVCNFDIHGARMRSWLPIVEGGHSGFSGLRGVHADEAVPLGPPCTKACLAHCKETLRLDKQNPDLLNHQQ